MRKFYLLLTVLFASLSAGAQQVTEEQALQKAQAFMKGKQLKSSTNVRSLSRARSKASQTESMYVFNVEDKGGFVIVSGDERTEPILGYSTSGEIDYDNMPDNLRSWLQGYEAQIRAISENPQLARRKTGSENNTKGTVLSVHSLDIYIKILNFDCFTNGIKPSQKTNTKRTVPTVFKGNFLQEYGV